MGDTAPESAETPKITDQSQPPQGLTLDRVEYPTQYLFESTYKTLADLYNSVVNPASRPELDSEQVFSRVGDLLLSPKMNFDNLTAGFNQILKDLGISPVRIEKGQEFDLSPEGCGHDCKSDGTNNGSYLPGQGRIKLPERLFNGANVFQLGNSLLHEANHYAQDILVTRAIIDDALKANPQADPKSPEFLAAISSKYEERFRVKPSNDFLRSVVEMRNGKELSPQERIRADRMTEGLAEHGADTLLPSAKRDRQSMKEWAYRARTGAYSPQEFVRHLLKVVDPASESVEGMKDWKRMLFANEKITARDIIRGFGDPDSPNFDAERARTGLVQLFNRRASDLYSSARDEHYTYKDYSHEVESFRLGDSFQKYLKGRRK